VIDQLRTVVVLVSEECRPLKSLHRLLEVNWPKGSDS